MQAAANLASKMAYAFDIISLPEASASNAARRDSVSSEMSNKPGGQRRKSALKSARAAARAQLKAEGPDANADDIRIAKHPSSKSEP